MHASATSALVCARACAFVVVLARSEVVVRSVALQTGRGRRRERRVRYLGGGGGWVKDCKSVTAT